MPEHDAFNASLEKRLFHNANPAPRKSWLWALFPSSGAVALAALLLFVSSSFQSNGVALADAIANTIQFTPSEELIEQTVTITKSAGVGAAPSDEICFADGVEGSCYLESFAEKNTWWLYGENVRVDTVRNLDGLEQEASILISDYDQTQCSFDSIASAQGNCSDIDNASSYIDMQLDIPRHLEPFENGGSLELSNLAIKPYVDPDGDTWDVLITWESDALLQDPMAMVSVGLSGYGEYGYPGRSWLREDGKFQNEIIYIYSEDLRTNAQDSFYADDSGKSYIQIEAYTGKSDVYLLNVDDYTLTPVSDAELEQSQQNYKELAGQFAVSLDRMERDYEFVFSNVSYLQEHLSELEALDEKTEGDLVTLSYGVSKDLGLYGGTNNALITKASFTLDQKTKRITEYSFYDADGTTVEHVEISNKVSDTDPKNIFTKEAWSLSF